MLDEQGLQTLFNQVHTLWIKPELNKRREAGTLSVDFKIRRCLIKLPKGVEPIVAFNDEITWVAKVKQPKGVSFKPGDQIFLWQVESVETVDPPTHNGERVAFLFLYWTGVDWRLIFDFNPNMPGDEYQPSERLFTKLRE